MFVLPKTWYLFHPEIHKTSAIKSETTINRYILFAGPPPAKRQKVQVIDTGEPLRSIAKIKSKSGSLLKGDQKDANNSSEKPKKKKKKKEHGEVEETFTPYDYNQADVKIFDGMM